MNTPQEQDKRIKPSLNSLIAQKERMRILSTPREEVYTETEEKLLREASYMSLQSHLQELRKRLIICIVVLFMFSLVAYAYSEALIEFLTAPAGKLYYMRPTEAFMTYMKVSLYAGAIAASPVIIYEIWAFIIPALTKGERRLSNWLIPVAICMFWLGILFAFFFVLPAAIKFFIGFTTDELQPLLSVGQYIDFIIAFILPFGIVFELPLVVMGLAYMGWISSAALKRKRKFFILAAFIIGGGISPTPDIFSQCMIALPMIVLYEMSVQVVQRIMRK